MNSNKFWAAVSRALADATITLIVVLMLVPGAWAASKFKMLHRFTGGNDGRAPVASLIFDAAGNLYGTTEHGGTGRFCGNGCGTVFMLTPNRDGNWTETLLYSFTRARKDGSQPSAGLIFDGAGNLYGTTRIGGTGRCGKGCGTVFSLTSNAGGSWKESMLYSFNGTDGSAPIAGLIFDSIGNLYGTTSGGGDSSCFEGCGVVFQLTPNGDGSWTESVLHSFNGTDGHTPMSDLIFDLAGNLYGTTVGGGAYGGGTVFQLSPNLDGSWTENILHSFNGTDGSTSRAGLIFDSLGNLYGMTEGGGAYGGGLVFQLSPNGDGSWTETVLYDFKGGNDGVAPRSSLVFDRSGNLYGTTQAGGEYGTYCEGAVFQLTPSADGSWTESVLHSFRNHPGCHPRAGLTIDAAGNLYGTTMGNLYDGGHSLIPRTQRPAGYFSRGTVFEITP